MQSKVILWGVNPNATVLKDKDISEYKTVRRNADISLKAVRREYEGAQLIVTAKEDIVYTLSVSDLFGKGGNVFSKENIKAFHCKYSHVKHNIEKFRDLGVGYYPNALVPFGAIEKYNENRIEKGNNQTLYFVFYVPDDQPAGVYRGSVQIDFEGETHEVPVEIEVFDITLDKENHLRSLFAADWDWRAGKDDPSFKDYNAFTEVLSEFRLGVYSLIPYSDVKENLPEMYKKHAELAYEYASDPRNTTYGIPYLYWVQSFKEKGLCEAPFGKFVIALAEKSFETGFNVLKKAVAHFGCIIDEPNGQGTLDRMAFTCTQYRRIVKELSAEILEKKDEYLKTYPNASAEFIYEVANTVADIPHIITAHYDEKYDKYVDYYCPCWWEYQIFDNRKYHERQKERWWYGCNGPMSPCPSYHLDDMLLSPRIVSWMQADYGYVGNLYWGVNHYAEKTTDYYGYNVEGVGWGAANGDGLLMFPAYVYGLDKPTVSLRMQKIRDGMEEYELLRMLKSKYEEAARDTGLDISYDDILHHMTGNMYDNIKIYSSERSFEYARGVLLELVQLANSPAKLCVKSLKIGENKICGEVFIAEGELLVNGKPCVKVRDVRGGSLYGFTAEGNVAELAASSYKDKTVNIKRITKKTVFKPDENFGEVFEGLLGDTEYSYEIINGGKEYPTAPFGSFAKFHLKTKGKNTLIVKFKPEALKTVGKNTDRLIFHFHNERPNKRYEGLMIKAKYSGENQLDVLVSTESYLAPGDTLVPVADLSRKDWEKLKNIEYIQFEFGEENEEQTKTRAERPDTDYIYFGGYEIVEFTE